MANKVRFLKGTAAEYAALSTKDNNTFYHITDDKQVYIGDIKLSSEKELAQAIKDIKANQDNITLIEGEIGDLSNLTTVAKSDLVSAIEELKYTIESNKTSGEIHIETDNTSAGMAKSYTIKQGTSTIGIIDIPKDMVVKSGKVVVVKTVEDGKLLGYEGMWPGTYIELTLANAEEDKIFIDVGTLVDIYTEEEEASQIQLKVDNTTRKISATVVSGSITTEELANDAVTTIKIVDKNVTKEKLADDIVESLSKADEADQLLTWGSISDIKEEETP